MPRAASPSSSSTPPWRGPRWSGRAGPDRGGRPLAGRLHRALLRHRRLTVALLLGGAAALSVRSLSPHPATSPALVATADAAAGELLAVRRVDFPREHLPSGAVAPDALPAASRAATAVRRGQVLTDASLQPSRALPRGSFALPVELPAAASQWVDEGARIMLYPTAGTEAFLTQQQEAPRAGTSPIGPVRVLATRSAEHTVADSGGAGGTVVLVAIDATDASRLADASASGSLWPALVP